jgi:hypothetical protein
MAKPSSSRRGVRAVLARIVKWLMVAVLIPVAIGLFQGVLQQLETLSSSGALYRTWVERGFLTYVWLHLLLYRPVALFRASHRVFSLLAAWLFGGQVTSVQEAGGKGRSARADGGEKTTASSPLVAFSPYVVPLPTLVICVAGWVFGRWLEPAVADAMFSFLIGLTMAFHWIMTADDLQQQRARWHVETYLLALGLVFILTLLIAAVGLPLVVPEFSFVHALGTGFERTQALYTSLVQNLFW